MNYCAKIKYSLYTAVSGSFEEMVTALLERISVSEIPVRLVFFDAPADNGMYVCRRDNLLALVRKQFPANCPVVSYVAQPRWVRDWLWKCMPCRPIPMIP